MYIVYYNVYLESFIKDFILWWLTNCVKEFNKKHQIGPWNDYKVLTIFMKFLPKLLINTFLFGKELKILENFLELKNI